jgi:hypothetical protein
VPAERFFDLFANFDWRDFRYHRYLVGEFSHSFQILHRILSSLFLKHPVNAPFESDTAITSSPHIFYTSIVPRNSDVTRPFGAAHAE